VIDVSVVVPVHNEAENVIPLTQEIASALRGRWSYEIIFVDDGSTDATLSRLGQIRTGHEELRILRHPRRCGQSAALQSAVQAARASCIVTLDGDGQNDPADVPRLLTLMLDAQRPLDMQMVVGHRFRRQDSTWRRLNSRVASAARRFVLRDDTPDSGCGLKVFTRDAFLRLPAFDHMHRFLPILMRRAGFAVRSVPVNHRRRRHGRSHYGMLDRLGVGILDLLGVLWLSRRGCTPVFEELSGDGK
jgi:dolichol-phosphate mannosyltransferase